jgi:hypothetical protein
MRRIDWNEIKSFYNTTFETNFQTVSEVLESGLKQFGTMAELSLKLDVSQPILRRKFNAEGLFYTRRNGKIVFKGTRGEGKYIYG